MGIFDRFSSKPAEAKFAELLIGAFRQAGEKRPAQYHAHQSMVVFSRSGTDDLVVNLRNLFAEYSAIGKRERPAWLKRVCLGLGTRMEMPDDFEDVKPDLRPSVRSRSALDSAKIQAEGRKAKLPDVPTVEISEHMVACLVYDLPNSMRFVTQENLDLWKVSLYEAMEVARQNLDELKPEQIAVIGERVYVVATGDAYDGTRILALDLMRALKVDGRPVALPITRDTLIVTGAEDVEGQRIMLDLADQTTQGRPLCAIPHVLEADEWTVWHPDGSPHFQRIRKLELRHFASEYAEQKELLEQRNQSLGIDVFVASFAGDSQHGADVSYCVWTNGVLTWLPRADFVILLNPQTEEKALVAWRRVQQTLGDLLEPMSYYPPRWATKGFPTAQQMQELRAKDA